MTDYNAVAEILEYAFLFGGLLSCFPYIIGKAIAVVINIMKG